MRTTITLDSDVADRLQELMREQGVGFKEAVNDTLRRGLGGAPPARFRQRSRSGGWRSDFDYEHALRSAGDLEDEELLRKMAQGR